jgi:hypothetical protein
MNKNLLNPISEEVLRYLNIKSISVISEFGFNPKYYVKYFNNTEKYLNEKQFKSFNSNIIKTIRKLKLQKLL